MISQFHNTAAGDTGAWAHGLGLGRAADEPFRVEIQSGVGFVVVRPIGELDLATAGWLEHALGEVEGGGCDRLVLDLRGLSFMDCAGVGLVRRARSRASDAGRPMEVVCGPGPVGRLLDMTGQEHELELVVTPAMLSLVAWGAR